MGLTKSKNYFSYTLAYKISMRMIRIYYRQGEQTKLEVWFIFCSKAAKFDSVFHLMGDARRTRRGFFTASLHKEKSIKYFILPFLFLLILSSNSHAASVNFTLVDVEKNKETLQNVVLKHVELANKKHQNLYIQVTAEWCGPCHKLRASMGHQLMKDAFAGTYILRIDYDDWEEQLSSLNINDKVVPIFYGVGSDGLATNHSINGGAWGDDIPENMAPPLKKYFSIKM